MSSDLGVQVFGQPNHEVFLGRDYGNTQDYSEETARRIDEEAAAHSMCVSLTIALTRFLSSHKEQMDLMSAVLLERETVDGEACTALLDNKWADYLKLEASGAVEKAANTLASKEPEQEAPAPAAPQSAPVQPAAPSAPASPASNEVQTGAQNGAAAPQAPGTRKSLLHQPLLLHRPRPLHLRSRALRMPTRASLIVLSRRSKICKMVRMQKTSTTIAQASRANSQRMFIHDLEMQPVQF